MINRLRDAYRRRRTVRNTINELSRLSDRELNDIGISRGQIGEVARGVL